MARPHKSGVDYFSHDTTSNGKTIFTLESKYGNDGYAFWFKLLEILGCQEGLFFDCNNESDWLYLTSKARVSEVTATEILDTLSRIDAIDKELWNKKVIWCQKFADRLVPVFSKRSLETPIKPISCDGNNTCDVVSVTESTQRKGKERKEKESKEKNIYSSLSPELKETWKDYEKHRKQLKKPMTERAVELQIKELNKLSRGDIETARIIIENSIKNGWQGLFEIKTVKQKGNPFDELLREELENEQNRNNSTNEDNQKFLPPLL